MIGALVFWVLLAGVCAAAYWFTGAALAGGALLCVILLPVLTWVPAILAVRHIRVTVELPGSSVKETGAEGVLHFHNTSILPVSRAICTLKLKNELTGEQCVLKLTAAIPPRGEAETRFAIQSGHCGYIRAEAVRIAAADLFGVLPAFRRSGAEGGMTILPQTFSPEVLFGVTAKTPEDSEVYAPDKKGNDYSETFQIREYAGGDSLKQIHWKLSSKLDKLMVRDASLPLVQSVLIFWDKFPGTAPDATTCDALAEVTISLCQTLSQMGYAYVLGWNEPREARCLLEDVPDSDALCQIIPRIIKNGGEDTMDGMERYMQTFGAPAFSKIIYLSNAVPPSCEEFGGGNDLNLIICQAAEQDNANERTIYFTPDNYLETLKMMELDV